MGETLDNKVEAAGEDVVKEGVVTVEEEEEEEEEVMVEEEEEGLTMTGGVVTVTDFQEVVDVSATDMKGDETIDMKGGETIDMMTEDMAVVDVLTVVDQDPPEILPQEDSQETMTGRHWLICSVS